MRRPYFWFPLAAIVVVSLAPWRTAAEEPREGEARVRALVARLGDPETRERDKAAEELAALGPGMPAGAARRGSR